MKRFLSIWLLAAFAALGSASAFAAPVTFQKDIAPPSCSTTGNTFSVKGTAKYNGNCGNQIKIYTGGGCSGGTTTWQGSSVLCQSNSYQPTLTMGAVGSGACTVSYEVKDNNGAAPHGDEGTVFTDTVKHCQTITVTTAAPASSSYGATFGVAATASSGLGVSIAGSGGCSGSGTGSATITMTSGTTACTVTYSQAGNATYAAATDATSTTTTGKGVQTITVGTPAPASAAYNSSFGVAATASSGLGVSIAGSGGCSGSGTGTATITMTSGTTACTVTYTQAGDANYNAASNNNTTNTTTASKASQTITVGTPAPASAAYNSSFGVAATASSGLSVSIAGSGGCSGSGTGTATITMTSPSVACTVTYSQAGNTNYSAAVDVTSSTTAGKASQTITVGTPAPASAAYNSSFGVAATASSGLSVSIAGSGGCSGSGTGTATITMTSGTTACTVTYSQAGDANYSAAVDVTSNTTASKASQTITVGTPAPASAAYNSSFGVAATASSGLGVSIAGSGGCSGSGTGTATITMTSGTTACTVTYSQAGNTNYSAAVDVTSSTTASKASQTITVGTPAPASAAYNSSFGVAATASSGLGVSIAGSGGCSGSGTGTATITMTSGTTACTVTYSQAGNTNYSAAVDVTSSTTAGKASQTITVGTPAPASAAYNSTFNVAATASSGLSVSIAGSGGCSGSGTGSATITMGNGTCTVTYSQAGNTNYSAAVDVTSSTSVGVDHIEIAHDGAAIGGVAETITVKACVNSGTGACVQYTGSQAITLSTTAGTFASSGTDSVTIAAFTGSTTESLTVPLGSSAALSVSSPTPATSAAYTCNSAGSIAASPSANCSLGFNTDHFQISQADSSSLSADGSTSKTITIRSCSNDRSAACTTLASDTRTVTLSNLGAGTLSSTSVTLVAGEGTVTLTGTSAGTAQLKVTAPAANNGYTCTRAGSGGTQALGSDTEASCQVALTAPPLHHYQISQSSAATLAADGSTTKTVTVKACGDLGNTCNALATGTASVTITSSLAGTGSSTTYAPLALTGGQATFSLYSTAAGTTTLATSAGSYRCSTDGGSTTVAGGAVAQCQMVFTVGALHHFEISQQNANSVPANGTSTKTITVKACADPGTTCNALATGEASVTITSSLVGTNVNPSVVVGLTSGVGSFNISSSAVGTTTLATGGSYRCSNDDGATSVAGGAVAECRVDFLNNTIHHYLISQANANTILDDGTHAKIITVKACTDTGATCNNQPAGSSTITVTSSLTGTSTTPSIAPLTLTNGVASFALSGTQSGITYLAIDSPPVGGYYCSTDGGTTLVAGGAGVSACQLMILVEGNIFKGEGIYSAIKTNWRRLGWSSCNAFSRDCAQTYDRSVFWVTRQPVVPNNKLVGSTTNPNKLWVVEASAYPGAYTIKDYHTGRCTALGTGSRELADADASLRVSSAGYLIYRTCDSAATEQQWLIQSTTAGDAVNGVQMRTIPTVGYLDSNLCWTDPVWTSPITELYVRNAVYGCGDWHNVFFFGGASAPLPLYVVITHPTSVSVTDAATIYVQACKDAACIEGYPDAVSIRLGAAGDGANTPAWPGGQTVAFPGGSTAAQSLTLTDASAEHVTVSVQSPSDANVSCTAGCVIEFKEEVGSLSLDVPSFYAHKGTALATLTACEDDGAGICVPVTGVHNVTFWAKYDNPGTGKTSAVVVNGNAVETVAKTATATGTPVALNFVAGVATFPVNYDDAGTMQLNAELLTATSVPAADLFNSVPAGFCVTTTSPSACVSGTAPGAGCGVFMAAGEPFGLGVQAVAWESDTDDDYCDNTHTPNFSQADVVLSAALVAPADGDNATLGVSSIDLSAVSDGSGSVDQTVSEVGIFDITASVSGGIDGLMVPQVQAGTQARQGDQLGRFVPKLLRVEAGNVPELDHNEATRTCAFSYSDTSFGFVTPPVIKISPLNGDGSVTRNYRKGSFMRLDTGMAHSYVDQSVTGAGLSAGAVLGHTEVSPAALDRTSEADGSLLVSLDDTLLFTRDGVVDAHDMPFEAKVKLHFTAAQLTDEDGVSPVDADGAATGFDLPDIIGTRIRLGQVTLKGQHVPATGIAELPLVLAYWNGSDWVQNEDDTCTSTAGFTVVPTYNGTLDASDLDIDFTHPAHGVGSIAVDSLSDEAGSVDIAISLGSIPAHLQPLDGLAPSATATFSNSASTGSAQQRHLLFKSEATR